MLTRMMLFSFFLVRLFGQPVAQVPRFKCSEGLRPVYIDGEKRCVAMATASETPKKVALSPPSPTATPPVPLSRRPALPQGERKREGPLTQDAAGLAVFLVICWCLKKVRLQFFWPWLARGRQDVLATDLETLRQYIAMRLRFRYELEEDIAYDLSRAEVVFKPKQRLDDIKSFLFAVTRSLGDLQPVEFSSWYAPDAEHSVFRLYFPELQGERLPKEFNLATLPLWLMAHLFVEEFRYCMHSEVFPNGYACTSKVCGGQVAEIRIARQDSSFPPIEVGEVLAVAGLSDVASATMTEDGLVTRVQLRLLQGEKAWKSKSVLRS